MEYENFLIREQNGEAEYQQGDTNCSDCNQQICACESLADWHRERETAFSQWLEAHGDSLPLPQSFSAWLEQSGDKI